jgi:hypothetical protein
MGCTTLLTVFWRDWRKTRNPSVRTDGLSKQPHPEYKLNGVISMLTCSVTRNINCHVKHESNTDLTYKHGARGSVVGWGTVLQAGRSRVPFPMRPLDYFNRCNPSSRTMALGSTQPLTEMSTRNLPRDKQRMACKAVSLTAICEPTV